MNNISINHIFIFCDNHNEVAQELIDFGFTEGVGRIHPNQGTRNRKFNFKNFYLEILWVHDKDEVMNDITSPTKLYERSKYTSNGYSPFGLCLNYASRDDMLFQNVLKYKPTYLPANMHIDVLSYEGTPSFPWTFRWKTDNLMSKNSDFVTHENSISYLTKAVFHLPIDKEIDLHVKHFYNHKNVDFIDSKEISLTLVFDSAKFKCRKVFNTVSLVIEY